MNAFANALVSIALAVSAQQLNLQLVLALRREQAAIVSGSTESFGRKLPAGHIAGAMTILIVLLFSKNAYTASFTSYYTST